MRRLFSLIFFCVLVMAGFGFLGQALAIQELAPPALDLVEDPTIHTPEPGITVQMFSVAVPPYVGEQATPTDTDAPPVTILKYITLAPNTTSMVEHPVPGEFLLTVVSGAICYTQGPYTETTSMVSVHQAATGTPPADCASTVQDCDGLSSCQLEEDDVVYLPVGSTLAQSNSTWHSFGNVGDVPAVIMTTEVDREFPGLPCHSGCPKP